MTYQHIGSPQIYNSVPYFPMKSCVLQTISLLLFLNHLQFIFKALERRCPNVLCVLKWTKAIPSLAPGVSPTLSPSMVFSTHFWLVSRCVVYGVGLDRLCTSHDPVISQQETVKKMSEPLGLFKSTAQTSFFNILAGLICCPYSSPHWGVKTRSRQDTHLHHRATNAIYSNYLKITDTQWTPWLLSWFLPLVGVLIS